VGWSRCAERPYILLSLAEGDHPCERRREPHLVLLALVKFDTSELPLRWPLSFYQFWPVLHLLPMLLPELALRVWLHP